MLRVQRRGAKLASCVAFDTISTGWRNATNMSIIAWILLGLIAGWLAGMIMGGRRGLLANLVLGVLGALIGGWVGSLIFGWDVTGFNIGSILLATLGAIILIAILRAIPGAQPLE
jgi:uncharacterized membrane protein YeaQ/YmgE (transglycosylase-associated protein family)